MCLKADKTAAVEEECTGTGCTPSLGWVNRPTALLGTAGYTAKLSMTGCAGTRHGRGPHNWTGGEVNLPQPSCSQVFVHMVLECTFHS